VCAGAKTLEAARHFNRSLSSSSTPPRQQLRQTHDFLKDCSTDLKSLTTLRPSLDLHILAIYNSNFLPTHQHGRRCSPSFCPSLFGGSVGQVGLITPSLSASSLKKRTQAPSLPRPPPLQLPVFMTPSARASLRRPPPLPQARQKPPYKSSLHIRLRHA